MWNVLWFELVAMQIYSQTIVMQQWGGVGRRQAAPEVAEEAREHVHWGGRR